MHRVSGLSAFPLNLLNLSASSKLFAEVLKVQDLCCMNSSDSPRFIKAVQNVVSNIRTAVLYEVPIQRLADFTPPKYVLLSNTSRYVFLATVNIFFFNLR